MNDKQNTKRGKRVRALLLPIGLLIYMFYQLWEHLVGALPDAAAIPMMIVSIVLMLGGIAYHAYCFGKHENPFDFK